MKKDLEMLSKEIERQKIELEKRRKENEDLNLILAQRGISKFIERERKPITHDWLFKSPFLKDIS